MELITIKITRPDLVTYNALFTDVKIRRDKDGITIYKNNCSGLLCAYYPEGWAVEVTKVEVIS